VVNNYHGNISKICCPIYKKSADKSVEDRTCSILADKIWRFLHDTRQIFVRRFCRQIKSADFVLRLTSSLVENRPLLRGRIAGSLLFATEVIERQVEQYNITTCQDVADVLYRPSIFGLACRCRKFAIDFRFVMQLVVQRAVKQILGLFAVFGIFCELPVSLLLLRILPITLRFLC